MTTSCAIGMIASMPCAYTMIDCSARSSALAVRRCSRHSRAEAITVEISTIDAAVATIGLCRRTHLAACSESEGQHARIG